MQNVYNRKTECSGCGLCKILCPHQAIEMQEDEEGFLYPQIDPIKCTDCGLCKKKCPFTHFENMESKEPKVFAAKSKINDIRKYSTSGGIFSLLSDYVLENKGTVYGAAYENINHIIHKRAVNQQQRDEQRDSKYVQSSIINIYNLVYADLKDGKDVLVTGTPCQVHEINNFLLNKKYTGNLYLCDIVCHGVGSPLIYRQHLQYLENKYNMKIDKICFRSKDLGWAKNCKRYIKCQSKDKTVLDDLYYKLYFNYNIISRPSCEKCPYASSKRTSDITIGDFWGIEKIAPDFEDGLGISLVIINSDKGEKLLQNIESSVSLLQSSWSNAVKENPRLSSPTKFGKMRDEFWRLQKKWEYEKVLKFYFDNSFIGKVKRRVYRLTK